MRKKYAAILLFFMLTLAACSQSNGSTSNSLQDAAELETAAIKPFEATISSPKAPAIFPNIVLAQEQKQVKLLNWETSDALLTQIQKNEAEFFVLPLNIGANLHAKGMPIQLIQVNTWGSMFLVSANETIGNLKDLAGQTIFVPSQGGPPDLLTGYLLKQSNLSDVGLSFVPLSEIGQQLASGTIEHAVIPEPMLSILQANVPRDLHIIVDFNQAWQEHFGQALPQTGIFVNKEWATTNQETIAQFQALSEEALNSLYEHKENILPLLSQYFDSTDAVMDSALTNSVLQFKTAQEAKTEVEAYFNTLLSISPDAVGDALPGQ